MLRSIRISLAALAVCAGLAVAAPSVGAAQAPRAAHAQPAGAAVAECKSGYYKNVSGRCVHRPGTNPKGATAKCRDGTYSYSQHASGTCSHHGGVARWIHHP